MPVSETAPISIKTAAGSGRSIDTDGRTDITSGSLVTLSTGDVVTAGNTIDGSAPHGMLEFLGYTHRWYQTGTVDEVQSGKITTWKLLLTDYTPDNVGGTITDIVTYPGGTGLRLFWSGSRNDSWTSLKIGATEGSAITVTRASMTHDGLVHKTSQTGGGTYITNTDGASMFFEIIA